MKTANQYKKLTIDEFTKAAEIYESAHAGIYEMCKDDYPYIESELAHLNYHDLLDCGCGTGPMISLLHAKNSSKHYVGLDLTPKMIECARKKNLAGTEWIVGDCENIPFDDESFDVIICTNSFHHYPNPQRFFDSAWRVLRPGGRLILQDYTASKIILWLMNYMEMPLANLIGHGDVCVYSLNQIQVFCDNAGFYVEKLEAAKKFRLYLVAQKII
ncbi:class I SAM-dependent methyltransferase [Selenomonas ruminantium]|uniref:Methyltransferase domain-containing protein n=1 Tax=Selenomonas ruminantium TaxID=971 RepID=A0A1H4A5G2_SELRU|nr:class I SAM-dependent methyltransferase [Selenomonas ruminantium]SEA31048.1 Methyltransferase domain-containing protein [Selenomonas ruminantium]